jgi:hypothetical protein
VSHLALVFGFIGRLYAIRCALNYDLSDLAKSEHEFTGGAARLWQSNMDAWKAATR